MSKTRNVIIYFLAFLIPIIILVVDYYLVGIFPFGNKVILYRDLRGQYISFFSAFRNAILGDGSLLYSFTKGLGGNMLGIVTYYLISPFNFIILIFPKMGISEAVLLIIILKIATCGLTFMYFIKNTFNRMSYNALIFSTAYALMSFNIAYQSNIMWLDAVYLTPLVMVGINKIINKQNKKLYIATLSITIMTNFYMGFMVCIFSVLYFFYTIIIKINKERLNIKYFLKRSATFIITSITAGLLSLVVILPTIFALQDGKSTFLFFTEDINTNFNIGNLISKIYINKINDLSILVGLPNIYTGILIAFLVIIYYFNKKISLMSKACTTVMFIIFILSLYINKLDYLWQGFNKPIGFPFRYTFLLSFFAIVIAYQAFINIKQVGRIYIMLSGILLIWGIVVFRDNYTYIIDNNIKIQNLSERLININVALIISYTVILLLMKKDKIAKVATFLLAIIFFIELGISSYNTFSNLPYATKSELNYYLKEVKETFYHIEKNDKNFYRMDSDFSFNANDSMLLNYKGMSHFSSMYKVDLNQMVQSFGFLNNTYWTYYGKGATLTSNSLLNFKYVISKAKYHKPGFKLLYQYDGLYVYENLYYLDMGFVVKDSILKSKIKDKTNAFEVQNNVLNNMVDVEYEKIYYPISNYKIKTENLWVKDNNGETEFNIKNKEKPAHIGITLIAQNNYPIYLYAQGSATVYVNGREVSGYNEYSTQTFLLGEFKEGQKVRIYIHPATGEFKLTKNSISYLNIDNYDTIYEELKSNPFKITSYNEREIKGIVKIKGKDEMLYTTIPYDEGWRLTVDGKPYPYGKILGALIGVKLPKGTYTLYFEFIPKGFFIGGYISLITLMILLIYWVKEKIIHRQGGGNK